MYNISLSMKVTDIVTSWAVYSVRDAATAKIIHIGYERLTSLFTISDTRSNPDVKPDDTIIMIVTDICSNRGEAMRQHSIRLRAEGMTQRPIHRVCGVECITTGEIFSSASEVVRQHGVNQSALSNHLNNKSGFRSVKGKIYRKLV